MSLDRTATSPACRRSRCHQDAQDVRHGFTLIELLVAVAIIALLIAILLPALSQARERARAGYCAANMRTWATSVHLYAAEAEGWLPMPGLVRTSVADPTPRVVTNPATGQWNNTPDDYWAYKSAANGALGYLAFPGFGADAEGNGTVSNSIADPENNSPCFWLTKGQRPAKYASMSFARAKPAVCPSYQNGVSIVVREPNSGILIESNLGTWKVGGAPENGLSYGFNTSLINVNAPGYSPNNPNYLTHRSAMLNAQNRPQTLAMFTEGAQTAISITRFGPIPNIANTKTVNGIPNQFSTNISLRHNGKANVAFVDGHVELLQLFPVNNTNGISSTNPSYLMIRSLYDQGVPAGPGM